MKAILKPLLAIIVAAAATSCGPSKYMMHLEMRYPSKAGVELAGKNVSIVYLENGSALQDGFNASMAEGMATTLENDYGTGQGSVGIYRMPRSLSGDYASKDSLTNILMDTGSDVVFLLDTVTFGEMTVGGPSKVSYKTVKDSSYVNSGSIPTTVKIYCFDAMNKAEDVKTFGGTMVSQTSVYSAGNLSQQELLSRAYSALPAEGYTAGELVGASFISQWKVEGYSVIYFDSVKWMEALEKADQLDWKGAMDIWFTFVDSSDIMKRSCAAYNIALACYMLGDYSLAEDWLDISDKEAELPMSSVLRKRIQGRICL